VTTTKQPADDAGEDDSHSGMFILACERIVKQEAARLHRTGLRAELADIEQEGFLILLEEKESIAAKPDPALVRVILRRRLLTKFVQRPTAGKRAGTEVSAEEIAHAIEDAAEDGPRIDHVGDRAVDQGTIDKMSVASHEEDCIDRVSMSEVADFVDYLQRPASPAARHELRKRWIPRMQSFVVRRSAA
jgi:hypothetical protein